MFSLPFFLAADPTSGTDADAGATFDPTIILFPLLIAGLIFFMWRSSKKRKAAAEQLSTSLLPGAEVMTTFGVYGTLISIDQENNTAELQIGPKNIIKVHSQAIGRVVTPTEVPADDQIPDSDNK